ncbi:MAG: 30S ribosomal protein S7 [Deltaproteobacteria bacterium]|nr:MAG: 30S ribosomal protein S7 [Deltaproteobacteria bacterium]
MEKPLLFNKWDITEVRVKDAGLADKIGLNPVIVPRSGGRNTTISFHKSRMNIVERLVNRLMVPGHRGKRHKITSGRCSSKTSKITLETEKALEKLEEKTKQNPVQVLVEAIENCALLEEVAAYRLGGIIARKAVITSPQRRLDLALRHLTQGIYKVTFSKKITLADAIADQVLAAYNKDPKCFAIQERQRMEKEAEGAR